MINHRANISAFHKLGVEKIIATSAVGSLRKNLRVGELGLAAQFLDFTRGRQGTFFDSVIRHTDMTYPYSKGLSNEITRASEEIPVKVRPGLVYVCAEGPRFETAAEIRAFRSLGGDVVGMTGVPEVVLANELGLEYAAILVVTNWAAGLQNRVNQEEVVREMGKKGPLVKDIVLKTIARLAT
jgi:5'-methylthioadenosine phosphorylase